MSCLQEITIKNYCFSKEKQADLSLSFQVFGQPLNQAPVVLVNHALTGNSEVAGQKGWWKTLVGKGQVIDLNQYTVIAFDIPGNGYQKNPEKFIPDYECFSTKTVADIFWRGLEQINIPFLYAVIGSSLGGGIAWEMAFLKPNSIKHLIPIATSLKSSDWLIGNVLVQDQILTNSKNPVEDARMHAMHLYRNPASFQKKFNNQFSPEEEQYAIESWLKHHGKTLGKRFSITAYKRLNALLKTIGKDLSEKDLIRFAKSTTIHIHSIAVDSDYLFTKEEQEQAFAFLGKYHKHIHFDLLHSIHGHDAFLIEYEQLNNLLKKIF